MDPVTKRLCVFFPLAFLLSWYSWLLKAAHVRAASGGINPLGPLVAALVVAGGFDGWAGIKQLLGRYLRWNVSWRLLAFLVMLPVITNAAAVGLNILLGAPAPSRAQLAVWPQMLPSFIFIFLFIGLGEETGWRGYALPWLQKRFSALAAALLLGLIWAAWHIPLMGVEFHRQMIPAFFVSILPASVILTWLFNRTQESLLPAPLFHALVNTVGSSYVFRMFEGIYLVRLWWIYSLLWVIAGVGVTVFSQDMMVSAPRHKPLVGIIGEA